MLDLGGLDCKVLEAYTCVLMVSDEACKLQCLPFTKKDDETNCNQMLWKEFGGCAEVGLTTDMVTSVCNNCNILYHALDRTYKLVDFMYQDIHENFHAFQVTTDENDFANETDIAKLEQVFEAHKLSIYYILPEETFVELITEPAQLNTLCGVSYVLVPNPNNQKDPY